MIRTVRRLEFWEMPNAIPHEVDIDYDSIFHCYDVMIDNTLYATVGSEDSAIEEIVKFLDGVWWTAVYPYGKEKKECSK